MSLHLTLAHHLTTVATALWSAALYVLLALLLSALAVYLFLRRLRAAVKSRTAELEQRTSQIGTLNAQLEISNEELQTSKEELEAANEELMLLNTDLEARNRELATLYKVAGSLNQSLDVNELVTTALERLGEALPPETCSHVLLAEDGSDAAPRTVASLRNWQPADDGRHDDGPLCAALFGRAAGNAEPFQLGDLRNDPATAALLTDETINGSCLAVPLRLRGEFIGALILVSHSFHQFTEEQVWLLSSIAESMAVAINNVRLFENLSKTLTDLKHAQDQLLRAEKLRSLGELAAGVAHDFNNVLGIILGNAQYLVEETRDTTLREGLRAIEQAAKDGARTVERVQDFVTAKGVEGFTRIDLNTVIRELARIAKTRLKQEHEFQHAHVELELIEGRIEPVAGDDRELREALTNIIFNALDAMPEGGTLTIETGQEDDGTFVRVTDTGIGMSADVKNRVFDPFFTTKGVEGTGLGMSVAYGIVIRHRGTIDVESEPGHGTAVTIWLPPADETMRELAEPEGAPLAGRSVRVLVIDDNVELTHIVQDILIRAGHEVGIAHDGATGLDAFRQGHHELVITDIGMPGISGWEVAQAVKQSAPQTGVILVTGWGKQAYSDRVSEGFVDALLPKPIDAGKLLRVLNQVASPPTD